MVSSEWRVWVVCCCLSYKITVASSPLFECEITVKDSGGDSEQERISVRGFAEHFEKAKDGGFWPATYSHLLPDSSNPNFMVSPIFSQEYVTQTNEASFVAERKFNASGKESNFGRHLYVGLKKFQEDGWYYGRLFFDCFNDFDEVQEPLSQDMSEEQVANWYENCARLRKLGRRVMYGLLDPIVHNNKNGNDTKQWAMLKKTMNCDEKRGELPMCPLSNLYLRNKDADTDGDDGGFGFAHVDGGWGYFSYENWLGFKAYLAGASRIEALEIDTDRESKLAWENLLTPLEMASMADSWRNYWFMLWDARVDHDKEDVRRFVFGDPSTFYTSSESQPQKDGRRVSIKEAASLSAGDSTDGFGSLHPKHNGISENGRTKDTTSLSWEFIGEAEMPRPGGGYMWKTARVPHAGCVAEYSERKQKRVVESLTADWRCICTDRHLRRHEWHPEWDSRLPIHASDHDDF